MLITILCLESLIGIWIILSTHMIEHKFRLMKNNLVKYSSKRVYKTSEDMAFVEKILAQYDECRGSTDDMHYIVNAALQKERIGKFSFVSVMNIATRAFFLLWGLLLIEGVYIVIRRVNLYDVLTLCTIGVSLMLTLGLSIYILIKALEKRKEQLIGEMIYSIKVIYQKNQDQKQKLKQEAEKKSVKPREIEVFLHEEDEVKEDEVKEEDKVKKEHNKKEEQLSAKDIADLINII